MHTSADRGNSRRALPHKSRAFPTAMRGMLAAMAAGVTGSGAADASCLSKRRFQRGDEIAAFRGGFFFGGTQHDLLAFGLALDEVHHLLAVFIVVFVGVEF